MECFTEVLPGTKYKCVGGLSVFGSPPLKLRGGLFGEFLYHKGQEVFLMLEKVNLMARRICEG